MEKLTKIERIVFPALGVIGVLFILLGPIIIFTLLTLLTRSVIVVIVGVIYLILEGWRNFRLWKMGVRTKISISNKEDASKKRI